MKLVTKKGIIGLTLGAAMFAGTLTPYIVHAADQHSNDRPAMCHHQVDPEKVAQKLADTFGVNKEDILKYQQQGVSTKDLYKASFFAKASGKSLKEVMAAKTMDNTWKDAAKSLGITREQLKAARQDIVASKMENKLSIPKQTTIEFMNQGYHSRDIAVAYKLAQNTGKGMSDVLAMKKINNTWYEVAQSLGVDDNTFKQDMKDLKGYFHKGHQREHF